MFGMWQPRGCRSSRRLLEVALSQQAHQDLIIHPVYDDVDFNSK